MGLHAVVVADAPNADLQRYRALLEQADLRIAADGGAHYYHQLDLWPHIVIGDLDSLAATLLEQLQQHGVLIERFPVAKNETDLELALLLAVEHGATEISILAASGGRPDMHLANYLLLAHQRLSGCQVAIRDAGWTIRLLLPGSIELAGQPGLRVSLIPLGQAGGIVTSGLRYPLAHEELALGPARGVSNEFLGTQATISLGSGSLLVFSEDPPLA